MDVLSRAAALGIEVKCNRDYFETRVYSKWRSQGHVQHFRTIEGLAGYVDGFNLATDIGEAKAEALLKDYQSPQEEGN